VFPCGGVNYPNPYELLFKIRHPWYYYGDLRAAVHPRSSSLYPPVTMSGEYTTTDTHWLLLLPCHHWIHSLPSHHLHPSFRDSDLGLHVTIPSRPLAIVLPFGDNVMTYTAALSPSMHHLSSYCQYVRRSLGSIVGVNHLPNML